LASRHDVTCGGSKQYQTKDSVLRCGSWAVIERWKRAQSCNAAVEECSVFLVFVKLDYKCVGIEPRWHFKRELGTRSDRCRGRRVVRRGGLVRRDSELTRVDHGPRG
jgi:hypothetical protein